MDKNTINKVLDATFELEGLLTLAATRDDDNSRIDSLILAKAQSIVAMIGEAPIEEPETPVNEIEDPEEEVEELMDFAEEEVEEEEPQDRLDLADASLFEEEEDANPSAPVQAPEYTSTQPSAPRDNKLKSLFSLNDKFRFRHELFGDSGAAFDTSLAFIGTLDSIEETEDYIYGDLGMDPDNGVVQEFMSIIEKHFER